MDLFLCNLSLLPKTDALRHLDFYITYDTSITSYITRLFDAWYRRLPQVKVFSSWSVESIFRPKLRSLLFLLSRVLILLHITLTGVPYRELFFWWLLHNSLCAIPLSLLRIWSHSDRDIVQLYLGRVYFSASRSALRHSLPLYLYIVSCVAEPRDLTRLILLGVARIYVTSPLGPKDLFLCHLLNLIIIML